MHKKSLEITCYVCGAGAFGVFFRWLQVMMAFDEHGLNEKSAFNVLVPLIIIASAWLFNRFLIRCGQKDSMWIRITARRCIIPERFLPWPDGLLAGL